MNITIDSNSGFCFGVIEAIKIAETTIAEGSSSRLLCLGDIVHNNFEINRLSKLGLHTVSREEFYNLQNSTVLLRAHGEPPETYEYAEDNGIELIDATCPVVIRLQKKIKHSHLNNIGRGHTILIYGKRGHAEVNGLVGQTDGEALVIESADELETIQLRGKIDLFSQTTKPQSGYKKVIDALVDRLGRDSINVNDTICKKVANRIPQLREFSSRNDVIIFVGGKQSSNAKMLYGECLKENSRSHFISNIDELDISWFKRDDNIGICGATSTPEQLMHIVADDIERMSSIIE